MIVWTCVRVTTNVSIPATLDYKIQLILYQVDNRDFKCYFSFFLFYLFREKMFFPILAYASLWDFQLSARNIKE
jgi:hypothetical protein